MGVFVDRLRQVLRRLGRAPLFTALTLITLAVGIGATTLIFSVVDGVLLKPLPYPQPERLIGIWYTTPKVDIKSLNIAPFLYFINREQNKTLEDIGVYNGDSLSVTGTGEPEHVRGLDVTEATLPLLGSSRCWGGVYAKDDTAGAPVTVILSYAYWQKKFGIHLRRLGARLRLTASRGRLSACCRRDFAF